MLLTLLSIKSPRMTWKCCGSIAPLQAHILQLYLFHNVKPSNSHARETHKHVETECCAPSPLFARLSWSHQLFFQLHQPPFYKVLNSPISLEHVILTSSHVFRVTCFKGGDWFWYNELEKFSPINSIWRKTLSKILLFYDYLRSLVRTLYIHARECIWIMKIKYFALKN